MAPQGELDEGITWNGRPQVEIPHQEEKYQQNSGKTTHSLCVYVFFSLFSTPSDQFIIGLPLVVAVFQITSYSLQLCSRTFSKSVKSFHSNFLICSSTLETLDCTIRSVLFSFQICKLFIIKLLLEALKIINQTS